MLKKNTTKLNNLLAIAVRWHLLIIFALLFSTVSLIYAYSYRNAMNPDGVSYIQVARHYANFDIKQAINGYWSPLISWLLVPAILVHVQPLFAFRILNILCIFTLLANTLIYIQKKYRLASMQEQLPLYLCALGIGLTLAVNATNVLTPDILSGLVLFCLITTVYRFLKNPSYLTGSIVGIILALTYFVKSIGIYLAITTVAFIVFYTIFKTSSPLYRKWRHTSILILVFLALVTPWIAALTIKYDRFTFSTASAYNKYILGPGPQTHPQLAQNAVIEAPHPSDIWIWDDPSYVPLKPWSTLEHLHFVSETILNNIPAGLSRIFAISPLVVIGILTGIRYVDKRHFDIQLLIILSIVLFAGYCSIYVEQRYFLFIVIPWLLAILLFLPKAQKRLRYAVSFISACAILLSCAPLLSLTPQTYTFNSIKANAKVVSEHIPAGSRVATENANYEYCFFAKLRCRGNFSFSDETSLNAEKINAMKAASIRYYLLPSTPNSSITLPVVTTTTSVAPQCYDLKLDTYQSCGDKSVTIYKVE